MRILSLIFFITILSLAANAQDINGSYKSPYRPKMGKEGELYLSVHSVDFLRNNEYFNPYTVGITYFGSNLQPEITYSLSDKASLSAGWFLRYYYGRDKFNASLPVFRLDYEPVKGSRLVFGQLYGQLDHNLIEPIYSTDNYFDRNPEYGFQYMANYSRFQGSVWISWDHFILPGDDKKEEITAGFNSVYTLMGQPGSSSLNLNLQGLVHHFGGQVDVSDSPLETRLSIAPGLEYTCNKDAKFSPDFSLATYLIQSSDQSSVATLPFKKGFGSYTYGIVEYCHARLLLSYFHGEYYFSPLGEKLFQSVSFLNDWYTGDCRNLAGGKFLYDREISKGLSMGIRFESYLDLDRKALDFSYGISFRASTRWLLHSFSSPN